MKNRLDYSEKEQKWRCANCGTTYSPEEVRRVWDYSLDPVIEELIDNPLSDINFIPCHCMDCGIIWYTWEVADE